MIASYVSCVHASLSAAEFAEEEISVNYKWRKILKTKFGEVNCGTNFLNQFLICSFFSTVAADSVL